MQKNNKLKSKIILLSAIFLSSCVRVESTDNVQPFSKELAEVEEIKVVPTNKEEKTKTEVAVKTEKTANAIMTLKNKQEALKLFNELNENGEFQEILNYLYRWYLDEDDFRSVNHEHRDQIWLRKLPVNLDEGDYSKYVELILPAIGVEVVLKKADYIIPELDLEMTSDVYKVIKVGRHDVNMTPNRSDF